MTAPRSTSLWTAVLLSTLTSACAQLPANSQRSAADPWERVNRTTHRFNNALDRAVLKPVATVYHDRVPEPVRTAVGNVIDNLSYTTVIANQLLQGKFVAGLQDTGRFLLNSTVGVAGIFDVATRAGLDKNDEDFGQTLGRWGVPPGPYLELPLLGPGTVRDGPTRYVDGLTQADVLLHRNVGLFDDDAYLYTRIVVTTIDARADLLQLDRLRDKAFDEYVFVRDAWLQRREYAVKDGNVEEEPIEIYSDEETGANEEALPAQEPPQTQEGTTPPPDEKEPPK